MERKNEIMDVSFELALQIMDYCEKLKQENKYEIAHQLIRSGTSVGANVREAQSAESKADFIHKLKIANKEALETAYWLELCKLNKNYPSPGIELMNLTTSVKKLLNKIIGTSKKAIK